MQNNKLKNFFKKHWLDIVVILAVVVVLAVLACNIAVQFNFAKKMEDLLQLLLYQ